MKGRAPLAVFAILAPLFFLVDPLYLLEREGAVRFEARELIDVLEHAQREYVLDHEGGELRVTLTIDDLDALRGGRLSEASPSSPFGLAAHACADYERTLIKSASACLPSHRTTVSFEGTLEGVLTKDGQQTPFRKRITSGAFEHYGRHLKNGVITLESRDDEMGLDVMIFWRRPAADAGYEPLCFGARRVLDDGRVDVIAETECPTMSTFDDRLFDVVRFVSMKQSH